MNHKNHNKRRLDNKPGKLLVYRVVPAVPGKKPKLMHYPDIPESASMEEDQVTKRICVCTTLPGAIEAAELVYNADLFDTAYKHYIEDIAAGKYAEEEKTMAILYDQMGKPFHPQDVRCKNPRDLGIQFWAMTALVDASKLYQPSDEELPDVWKTGELWLLEPTKFNLYGMFHLRRQMFIGNTPYARYSVSLYDGNDYDEVIDRHVATAIYGEEIQYSFITLDPQLAAEWEEEHKNQDDDGED